MNSFQRNKYGATYSINASQYRVMRKPLSVSKSRMFNIAGIAIYIDNKLYTTEIKVQVVEYLKDMSDMYVFNIIFEKEAKLFVDANVSTGNYIDITGELVLKSNVIELIGNHVTCYRTEALRPIDPQYVKPDSLKQDIAY